MPILSREEANNVLLGLGSSLESELQQLDDTVSPIFDEFQEPQGIFKTLVDRILAQPVAPKIEDEFPDVKSLSNIAKLRKQGWDEDTIKKALTYEIAQAESTKAPLNTVPPPKRERKELQEGPRTVQDVWNDYAENPWKLVPFMAGAVEANEITPVIQAAYALHNDTETEDDLYTLKEFISESNRDSTFLAKVMSVVAQLPAFAGELATTWGIYTVGRKAGMKGAKIILEKLLKESGEELLDRRLTRIAIKSAGGIAGGTLQTPAAGVTRIYAGTLRNMMPELGLTENELGEVSVMINSPGDDVGVALLKSFGEQWVETVSEHSGGLFSELGEPIMKSGLIASIMRSNPNKSVSEFKTMLKRFGWNGIINEMWEERVGEVGRAVLGLEDWKLPSLEQLAVELVAFSVPGAAIATTGKAIEVGENIKHEKQLNRVITKFNEDDIPFTIEFDDENTGEIVESESWYRESNYDPEAEGFEQVGEKNGEKQYKSIKLGLNTIDDETGSVQVLLNSKVGRDVVAEEVVEGFFKQAERRNPELAAAIRAYAGGLRASLIAAGKNPGVSDIELFSKAFVFHHLGYANTRPDYASLYSMPQEMYNSFVDFMGDFKDGTNIAEFLKGNYEVESGVFSEQESEAIAGQAIAEDTQERAPPAKETFQMVPAYHYSKEYGIINLSPEKMDLKKTNEDAKRITSEKAPKRVYFYLGEESEPSIKTGANVLYTSIVETDDYYDLIKDKQGLWDKHNNLTSIENDIKSQGFKGHIGYLGGNKNMPVLASYYDVPVGKFDILRHNLKKLAEKTSLPKNIDDTPNILSGVEVAIETLFNKNPNPTGKEIVKAVRGVRRWKRKNTLIDYKTLLQTLNKQLKKNPEFGNWYDSVAKIAKDVVGIENIVEFSGLFGITSAQASPEVNFANTLFIMRMARKYPPITQTKEFKEALKNEPLISDKSNVYKFLTDKDINKISNWYNHVEFAQENRFKTPLYAQTIKERAFNEFFPFTVHDTWMSKLFGLNARPNDVEYRIMNHLVARLARETNIRPDVVQALLWDSVRGKGKTPGTAESIQSMVKGEIDAYEQKPLTGNRFETNPDKVRIFAFTKDFAVTPDVTKAVKEHAVKKAPKIALEITRVVPEFTSPEKLKSIMDSLSGVLFTQTRTGLKLKLAEHLGVPNQVEQSFGVYEGNKSPNYIISFPGSSIDVAEQISSTISKALHQKAQFVFKIKDGEKNAFVIRNKDGGKITSAEQNKFLEETGLDYTLINNGEGLLVYPYDNFNEVSVTLKNSQEGGKLESIGVSLDAKYKEQQEYTKLPRYRGLTRGRLDTKSWADGNLFDPLDKIIQRNPEFFGGTKEKPPPKQTFRLEREVKQGPSGPIFYSTARVALNKFPKTMNSLSVKNWLKKSQVKPEEMEWLDIETLLKGRKKISKEELQDWIQAHEIVVEEVVKHEIDDSQVEAWWTDEGGANEETPYSELSDSEQADAIARYRDEVGGFSYHTTKFAQHTEPGGTNYRELLLTLPDSGDKGVFTSHHFNEPNILAHIRFNTRYDSDGNKVLFIEEIQSDWHQEGRDKGYKLNTLQIEQDRLANKISGTTYSELSDSDKKIVDNTIKNDGIFEPYNSKGEKVPNAPFKGDGWLHLSLKRMLRYAAENDFDKLSWTTGAQQVERYETATRAKVDKIHWQRQSVNKNLKAGEPAVKEKMADRIIVNGIKNDRSIGTFTVLVNGSTNINGKDVSLESLLGKSMANKIRESDGPSGTLEGADLTIGGEGMKMWYDNKLPTFLKKYGKRWGVELGTTSMYARAFSEAEKWRMLFLTASQMKAFKDDIISNEKPFINPSINITPKMKDSVLEGQATFRLEGEEIPGWVYDEVKNEKIKIKRTDKPNWYQMAIVPISQRLFRINPELRRRIRHFDYKVMSQTEANLKRVMPFINAMKKLDPTERAKLDLALKNGDSEMVDIIFERNKGLKRKYMSVRKVLDETYDRAQEAGFDMGFIDEYFPRMVSDYEGFIKFMYGTYKKGALDKEIKAKEKEIGRKLTMEERAELLSARIRGFGSKVHESKPGSMKERKVPFITSEMNSYYHSLEHSLTHYISNMINAIETRDFFQSTEITEETIGDWVSQLLSDKKIKPEQQEELVNILKIRFNPQPISVGANNLRAIGYFTSMGSISSAITQIGDMTWAFYLAPKQSLGAWGKAITGKSKIKKSDLGIDRISQEFSDFGGLSSALNNLFKVTGLEWMDKLGKETLINATIKKYQKMAREGTLKESDMYRRLEEAFGEETGKVIGDLKRGVITENVKYLAFYTLADFQPISLSEMPEGYLKSPHGRLLYMLKTFTIKQFDAFRNESINLISRGRREDNQRMYNRGIKNMILLATIFALANASADAIKDLIFNRKIKMSDYVADNILRLFGVHRYLYFYAQRYGLWNTAWRAVSPPVDIIEAPFRDLKDLYKHAEDDKLENFRTNELESIKMIPLFGKLYYWWFGKGPRVLTEREIKDARKASKTDIFDIDAEKEYKAHLDYALEMGWFDEDKHERWLNDYGKAQRKLKGKPEPRKRRKRRRR